ncbi:hypothetical protein, partial [Pseudobacillus badius]
RSLRAFHSKQWSGPKSGYPYNGVDWKSTMYKYQQVMTLPVWQACAEKADHPCYHEEVKPKAGPAIAAACFL